MESLCCPPKPLPLLPPKMYTFFSTTAAAWPCLKKEKIKENGVISRLSMITQVNIVLNRTVVDSDWRFDDCEHCSHLHLHFDSAQAVEMLVTVNKSSIQDYVQLDVLMKSTHEMTPGLKPFTKWSSSRCELITVKMMIVRTVTGADLG